MIKGEINLYDDPYKVTTTSYRDTSIDYYGMDASSLYSMKDVDDEVARAKTLGYELGSWVTITATQRRGRITRYATNLFDGVDTAMYEITPLGVCLTNGLTGELLVNMVHFYAINEVEKAK